MPDNPTQALEIIRSQSQTLGSDPLKPWKLPFVQAEARYPLRDAVVGRLEAGPLTDSEIRRGQEIVDDLNAGLPDDSVHRVRTENLNDERWLGSQRMRVARGLGVFAQCCLAAGRLRELGLVPDGDDVVHEFVAQSVATSALLRFTAATFYGWDPSPCMHPEEAARLMRGHPGVSWSRRRRAICTLKHRKGAIVPVLDIAERTGLDIGPAIIRYRKELAGEA
jgi:hypothetical protein